jgi:antitoxin component HigA of HigAB toxin-antitoxin module
MDKNKQIETEQEYQETLKRLDALLDAPEGTIESDQADVLASLVYDYLLKHDPDVQVYLTEKEQAEFEKEIGLSTTNNQENR